MATPDVPRVVDAPSSQVGFDTFPLDADGVFIQAIPADPRRRSCLIVTDANAAGIVYLYSSGGGTSGGFRLVPGAGLELKSAAAIYARSEGGDQTLTIVSESSWSC